MANEQAAHGDKQAPAFTEPQGNPTTAKQGLTLRPEIKGFASRSIHGGYYADSLYGSVNVPIYASSTFVQNDLASLRGGYEYTRVGNPTLRALEDTVAALEGATYGLAFASGMSAIDSVLRTLLRPGRHLIIGNDAYGGTFRLLNSYYSKWGVEFTVVDLADTAAVVGAVRDTTDIVWLESPSNPMLSIADIAAISEGVTAKNPGAKIVVDNTFASPYLQQPLALGAHIVVHSATKYLGGHSDVIGGVVVHNDADFHRDLKNTLGDVGPVPSVFDAYLTARGIKTLEVRMERHCSNAQAIAELLDASDETIQVLYPGLKNHPGHEVAAKQMRGFGGMISVRFHNEEQATEFCRSTKVIQLAESLGGVESLIEHPAQMTHLAAQGSQLEVPRDLVRISIGIESIEDLKDDIQQALDKVAHLR